MEPVSQASQQTSQPTTHSVILSSIQPTKNRNDIVSINICKYVCVCVYTQTHMQFSFTWVSKSQMFRYGHKVPFPTTKGAKTKSFLWPRRRRHHRVLF